MNKWTKWLILGVMASVFICGSGYAADPCEEMREAIQQQYFPYKVIKPMDVWKSPENAALYGYFYERSDYGAVGKLKQRKSDDLRFAGPGSLIELTGLVQVDISDTVKTGVVVLSIRVKGSIDFVYVDNDYFSSCTKYVGIGSIK